MNPDIETRRLVIVGSGGMGRELHELIQDCDDEAMGTLRYEVLGWLDGNTQAHSTQVHGLPVLGDLDWIKDHPDVEVAIGIGAPATRRKVVEKLRSLGHTRFATLIHPTASVGRRVSLGDGTIICTRVIVTTDVQIGQHVLINNMATITHDDVLGDFVTIAPAANISGNVTIGEGVDVGTNVAIVQGVEIGAWSIVGAGAVVNASLPPNCTAVGVPAKPIKERPDGWQM